MYINIGFGKSLTYQVAPMLFNQMTEDSERRILIIQPTVALVKDSIKKLKTAVPELAAVHLTPSTLHLAKAATYIFSSPEMILSNEGRKLLLMDVAFASSVSAVFIDECHLVQTW